MKRVLLSLQTRKLRYGNMKETAQWQTQLPNRGTVCEPKQAGPHFQPFHRSQGFSTILFSHFPVVFVKLSSVHGSHIELKI